MRDAAKAKKDEQEKLREEQYKKNLEEFEAEQKRFREEHPEKVKEEYASPEDLVSV